MTVPVDRCYSKIDEFGHYIDEKNPKGMGISARNSSCFFCIECQPMRRIHSYSFSDGRNERRLISYWTIKGATGGGVSGRRRGGGGKEGKGGPGERKMKEEDARGERRKKEGKSFIPCDDKGLSQSRLIACSSPLQPSFHPFAVATNFDSCFAYATLSPALFLSPDLVQPRALDPFTTELSQFRHFALGLSSSSFPVRKAPFGITTNVHRSIDEGRDA